MYNKVLSSYPLHALLQIIALTPYIIQMHVLKSQIKNSYFTGVLKNIIDYWLGGNNNKKNPHPCEL